MARKTRARRPGRALLLLIAAAALVGIGYLVGQRASESVATKQARRTPQPASGQEAPKPIPPKPAPQPRPEPSDSDLAAPAPAPEREASTREPAVAGRIAIVIDDLGRSLDEVERLLALGVPLTYAVLPWERRTSEVAARLEAARVEVLCHLPMESERGANPGPNAILEHQPPRRVAALTRQALDALPGAIGLNNHMGSRITADREAMGAVLRVVAERGLLFLDSRTTADTVAFEVARELSVPAARRDVFLDEDPHTAAIETEFDRLLDLARAQGAAVAIGHPRPATLEVLARRIPEARAAGFEFVPISYLVERSEALP